jgi:hypothetical protein
MSKSEPFNLAHKVGTSGIEPWSSLPGPSVLALLPCATVEVVTVVIGTASPGCSILDFYWYPKSTALSPFG